MASFFSSIYYYPLMYLSTYIVLFTSHFLSVFCGIRSRDVRFQSAHSLRTHYALGRADQLKVSVQKSYLLFLHILNPSFLSVFSQNLSKSVSILACAFNRTLFGRIAQSVTIANELILNCSYTVTDGKTKLL